LAGLLDDQEIRRRATRLLTEEFGFHMSWIAEPTEAGAVIRHTSGNLTHQFYGVVLSKGLGLGGKVFASGRLQWVDDYLGSRDITHDYDKQISAEHVQRVIAAPMIVNDRNFGVLLGAHRDPGSCGERAAAAVEAVAERCAQAFYAAECARAAAEAAMIAERQTMLAVHDTVGAMLQTIALRAQTIRANAGDETQLEELLEAIELQANQASATLRESMLALATREPRTVPSHAPRHRARFEDTAGRREPGRPIAQREYDVLCRVATGETNHEIAAAMDLSCNTVKTYLRNVMSKLGARNRVEAIVHARELGIL
jgi:DNA-binding NarL/FixJ family response regulator